VALSGYMSSLICTCGPPRDKPVFEIAADHMGGDFGLARYRRVNAPNASPRAGTVMAIEARRSTPP